MPKLKTSSTAAKRFKVLGSGKIRRSKAYHRHNLTCKSREQKRNLKGGAIVDDTNERAIRRLLPYG